jgi:hypothetical protein
VKRESAQDLGPIRLERKNGFLTMTPGIRRRGERGFSLLIKEAGLYTLEGKIWGGDKDLRIQVFQDGENQPPEERSPEKCLFSAILPLVFRNHEKGDCLLRGGHKRRFSDTLDAGTRSRYSVIITACDAEGPAAFIAVGEDLIVIPRDDKKA